jgi:hypothetical protein
MSPRVLLAVFNMFIFVHASVSVVFSVSCLHLYLFCLFLSLYLSSVSFYILDWLSLSQYVSSPFRLSRPVSVCVSPCLLCSFPFCSTCMHIRVHICTLYSTVSVPIHIRRDQFSFRLLTHPSYHRIFNYTVLRAHCTTPPITCVRYSQFTCRKKFQKSLRKICRHPLRNNDPCLNRLKIKVVVSRLSL